MFPNDFWVGLLYLVRLYLIENRWGHLFHDFGPAEPEGRSQTRPVEQRSHAQLFPLIKLQLRPITCHHKHAILCPYGAVLE